MAAVVAVAPRGRGFGRPHRFLYLFGELYVIIGLRSNSAHFIKGARVAAPSVCFAAARILLAAAPTAPPCFRHWRRSSPLQVA